MFYCVSSIDVMLIFVLIFFAFLFLSSFFFVFLRGDLIIVSLHVIDLCDGVFCFFCIVIHSIDGSGVTSFTK